MTSPYKLSVIVPTIGRSTLSDTLDSIINQRQSSDVQVIVVEDAAHTTPELCTARTVLRRDMHWCSHGQADGVYGQPQRNHGIEHATGEWLAFLQDDDIWTENALDLILLATSEYVCPLVFQVKTWQAGLVPRLDGSENDYPPASLGGNVDADGIVVPNTPGRFGQFTNEYGGDFEFLRSTVRLQGGPYAALKGLISIGRPTSADIWWKRMTQAGY